MKILICFPLLFLLSCNSDSFFFDKPKFSAVDLTINSIRSNPLAGGDVKITNNYFYFESHTNQNCAGVLKGSCRKADVTYLDNLKTDRIVKYSFVFNVLEYNLNNSPDFVIIFQDWVRVIDGLSNHPITTLKIKNINGLSLCGYNNSWQFDWTKPDWGHVSDGSIHNHPSEELNGCKKIEIGVNYYLELLIYDNDRVKLLVDDQLVFDKHYKTKLDDKIHIHSIGLYWSKGYNLTLDPLLKIKTTVSCFTKSVAHLEK